MRLELEHFDSLISLVSHFNSDKRCRDFITEQRWHKVVVCPFCGSVHIYTCSNGDNQFKCGDCHKRFSCLVGTIFENTKLPLQKWFMAMYLISSHKKGISSYQLSKDIHVTQKTAWFILHKVRTLFNQYDTTALEGEVELDEMYLGGRETNKHESKKTERTQGRSTKTKTPIFGMVSRKGEVRAIVVPNTQASTLVPIIKQFVDDNAHIFTDELSAYSVLDKLGYKHDVIRHCDKEFSKNGITTNSIEGFWGHFKRMVFGTYHFVSKAYLQQYINEAVYRYNTRKISESSRLADMFAKSIGACSYDAVKMLKAA
ncbi:MAG: IS1595 family transposase [Bacteroidales bacterium]|nr:IS1595 family transposase [Bacteroidales bacterium]MBR6882236.1 IS1595 family transposase [Bacteroidales bacterium]